MLSPGTIERHEDHAFFLGEDDCVDPPGIHRVNRPGSREFVEDSVEVGDLALQNEGVA